MVYITDNLSFALSLTGGLPLLQSYPARETHVKELLEENEYRSCVTREFAAKKLTEMLERDITTYKGDLFRIQEGDMIIYFHANIYLDEEGLPREIIQHQIFEFTIVKIVDVVINKEDGVKYFH